jgi:zona occludens toxin (predicted ATPase)
MKKTWVYPLLVMVGFGALAFAYYAISPLFITIRSNDAAPESQSTGTRELAVAQIVDTPVHPASGTLRVLQADGKTFVRYENYKTINGPDIYVYLANDLEAKEFVDLGRVKATEGNVNYEIPAGVEVSDYRYVLTWCKAFGVLFNYADISA